MKDRIVVLGAGALSLGFLGPELSETYGLTFLDTEAKSDLIEELQRTHAYAINLAGDEVQRLHIRGIEAFRIDLPEDDPPVREHVAKGRIFFTAVGIRNLDRALASLNERIGGRRDPIYILCAENGQNIAEKWRREFPDNIRLCDTVMGRMCRIEAVAEPDYSPVTKSLKWGVVAEPLRRIPVSNRFQDPTVFHGDAFLFVSDAEFHARERIKLFAHNGLHFYIAALGRLRNVERLSDLAEDAAVRTSVEALLRCDGAGKTGQLGAGENRPL